MESTKLYMYLWIKFVVPSMGSIIQVGLSVKSHFSPAATDSSPIKLNTTNFMRSSKSLHYMNVITSICDKTNSVDTQPTCEWGNVPSVLRLSSFLLTDRFLLPDRLCYIWSQRASLYCRLL